MTKMQSIYTQIIELCGKEVSCYNAPSNSLFQKLPLSLFSSCWLNNEHDALNIQTNVHVRLIEILYIVLL